MNKSAGVVEMPAGHCKTTEIVKSFSKDGNEVFLRLRTEERHYKETVILEQEKTRVFGNKKGISIVKINIIKENGTEKKVVELAAVVAGREKTSIKRRKKMLKEKQLVSDYEICEEESKDYYGFRDEIIQKCGLCRVKR